MPKIGDGYFQFSSRGLKDLIKEIKDAGNAGKALEGVGRGQGFFSDAIGKDLASLKRLVSEAKGAKRIIDQLKSVTAESSLGVDRQKSAQRARLMARQNIASGGDSVTASSASSMAAERLAQSARRSKVTAQRRALSKDIASDPSTTAAFKARAAALKPVTASTPTGLRKAASDIRDVSDSLKRFKKGNVAGTRAEMELLAKAAEKAADSAQKLQDLELFSANMSPEAKRNVRGETRDEMGAGARSNAIDSRQAQREIEGAYAPSRMSSRIQAIDVKGDLSPGQKNTEINLAADEIADNLQNVAKRIRDTRIERDLSQAARAFASGTATGDQLTSEVARANARKAGSKEAGGQIDDSNLRSRNGGAGAETIALKESLDQLIKKRRSLASVTSTLYGAELDANEATQRILDSDIVLAEAKVNLSMENDRNAAHAKSESAKAIRDAADRIDQLRRLRDSNIGNTDDQARRDRGEIRDEMGAEDRGKAISARQAQREIDDTPGANRMALRAREIDARSTELSPDQKNIELSLAGKEVADSLREVAQKVREAPLDEELAKAARKFGRGGLTDDQFKAESNRTDARRSGSAEAGGLIEDAGLRAENRGAGADTIALTESLAQLKKKKEELVTANAGLTDSELEVNQATQDSIDSDILLTKSKVAISKEIDKNVAHNKKLMATKSKLDAVEAQGGKLTKEHKEERNLNNKELAAAAKVNEKLTASMTGGNRALHNAAGASRRYNFQLQQASYGVQDFVQVIGQTGLSGALRASANNMASFFGASGTPNGAIIGAVGTIAMIGFADAIQHMGGEAETAEKKLEKLTQAVERFINTKKSMESFAAGLFSDALGKGAFSSESGAEAGRSAREAGNDSEQTTRNLRNIADSIGADAMSSWNSFANNIETDLAGLALAGGNGDKIQEIINNRIEGMSDPDLQISGEDIEAERIRLNRIASIDASTPEGAAELAGIIDPASEELQEALRKFNETQAKINEAFAQMEQSFVRLDASLGEMEADTARGSQFGGTGLTSAASSVGGAMRASSTRLDIAQDSLDRATTDEQKEIRQKILDEERRVYGRLSESMDNLTQQVQGAPVFNGNSQFTVQEESNRAIGSFSSNGPGAAMSAIAKYASEIEKNNLALARARSGMNSNNAEDAAMATFEFERLTALSVELGAAFANVVAAANAMPIAFGNTDRLIGSQASRDATANRYGSFETSQRQIDPYISQIEASQAKIRNAQRTQRDSVIPAEQAVAAATIARENQLIAELTASVNALTGAAADIPSSLQGITGSIASEITANSARKLRAQEAGVLTPEFDQQNTQASMQAIGDDVLNFTGKVQRRLGEEQDVANDREKARIQNMIDALQADNDLSNDALIPMLEMAQRKIDATKGTGVTKDSQANTSVTPIESLHQKIQESLKTDTKDFDLQKEQAGLLGQIAANTDPNINVGGVIAAPPGSGFMSVPPGGFGGNAAGANAAAAEAVTTQGIVDARDAYRDAPMDDDLEEENALRQSVADFVNAGGSLAAAAVAAEEWGDNIESIRSIVDQINAAAAAEAAGAAGAVSTQGITDARAAFSDSPLGKDREAWDAYEQAIIDFVNDGGSPEAAVDATDWSVDSIRAVVEEFNAAEGAATTVGPETGAGLMPSNANTNAAAPTAVAQQEATRHARTSAEKLTELVQLLKGRNESGGILLG